MARGKLVQIVALLHASGTTVFASAFVASTPLLQRLAEPSTRSLRMPVLKMSVGGASSLSSGYCSSMNGCWAGWQASFEAKTGKLKPVDRKYLTDSMLSEDGWGEGVQAVVASKLSRR